MLKYKCILIFSLVKVLLFSQNNHQFSGQVFDENNRTISNVNIFLDGARKGTVTNENGAFTINYTGKEDKVTFSYMGYKPFNTKIDSTTKSIKVRLVPAVIQLSEIQVTNLSAEKLVDKAISKISENYCMEEFLEKDFYRATVFSKSDSLIYVEETMFEQVKSYKPNFEDKTFLVRNRNFNFLNKEFGIKGVGIYDNVKILSRKGRHNSKNVYTYGTPSFFDGKLIYVIEINKHSKIESAVKGKIFIDTESLAFVRFELCENNKKQTSQYKKIGSKYYLVSQEISNKNESSNGGYGNVKAQFVLTDIMNTFEKNDIKGTLISKDEIIRSYSNQEYDVSFWKTHNSVLPDTIIQQRINKFVKEQGLSKINTNKKEIEEYVKLYNPNISLKFSTEFPDDINSLSRNSVSVNLLTNYLAQNKINNFYLKLLATTLINVYLIAPLEEIESERELLSLNGLHTKIFPFMFNSIDKSYHYGLSQSQLENFKTSNYFNFMRLHTLRGEYHYLKTKILEEDIAKADMDKRNNKKNYITLYLMDLLYNRTYNIFYSQLKDKIINSNDSKNSPLIVDIDKSWVKYLFDQDKPFTSHTKTESLTASEKEYLKRSTILSWINLISPQLISLSKFPISENTHATFSLNYLRIPFGGLTEQNFWIKYKNLLNGMFIRQYLNKEKVCFGIGYKMYDLELRKNLNLTSTIDYWKQPVNLNFYDKNLKNGFHIGQELECKLGQDFYSNRNKVSIFIGYEYKTIGYLPENIEINEQFKINFGLKINFNQSY